MSRKTKTPSVLRAWVFLVSAGVLLVSAFLFPQQYNQNNQPAGLVRVERVVDGDTFKLVGGERVRLLGIDTPEMHESNKLLRDVQRSGQDIAVIKRMGHLSYEFVRPLIEGHNVRLEYDIQKKDKYGRLLAYVYLEDGTFLNKHIIENGYASPLTIPPNIRHADEFKALFKAARAQGRGLWRLANDDKGSINRE